MAEKYVPTIGVEVHVELSTQTKMFCGCGHFSQEMPPNFAVCPVCLGLPGSLPAVNDHAVTLGIRAALALHCRVNDTIWFERKNYLYPDLVKGYQISQYDQPLGEHGWLAIDTPEGEKRVGIRRAHLEEDTAKLIHADGRSWVDANRSSAPLLEIVTEPVLRSAAEAEAYVRKLRATLVYYGVSRCRIQRGEMRVEANVSIAPPGADKLGVRTEIKNQAGFNHMRDAIEHEIERHAEVLAAGGKLVQETRGWDAERRRTFSQRSKEDAHDYRYFPDPDLLPIQIPAERVEAERASFPEPLEAYTARLRELGVTEKELDALVRHDALGFLRVAAEENPGETLRWAKRLGKEVFSLVNATGTTLEDSALEAVAFREAVALADAGDVAPEGFRTLLEILFREGGAPADIAKREGLLVTRDDALIEGIVREVLAANPKMVEEFKSGKAAVRNALFGQAMKKLARRGLPQDVNRWLDELLG